MSILWVGELAIVAEFPQVNHFGKSYLPNGERADAFPTKLLID